ncbi:disease resistance protein RPM1-like [Phoenix dactylifera]|uniref:Disease resistance protein RPM1-like n=1 Tax=Phoenix dactylifera TaxID=42345 RepID=A0A8B9ASF7_PHODC|nr:disease resistance protein RPM1-like [Phoenix dactylifera]
MATTAIGALSKKLSDVVSSEINMPGMVRQDVRVIEAELSKMKAFLWSADAKVATNAEVKAWVKQVNELAYDTEDLIDEFKVHIARPRRRGVRGFFYNIIQLIKKWRELHEIHNHLQLIKEKIKRAQEGPTHFGLHPVPQVPPSTSTTEEPHVLGQLQALFVEERELVGIDEPRNHLIRWLLEGSKSLRVISVVAMGGMGKTALVKKVYDSPAVRIHGFFDCHVWITLSQNWDFKILLRDMIKQLSAQVEEDPTTVVEVRRGPPSLLEPYISIRERREMQKRMEIEAANESRLIQMLRDHLKNKRYVIVFDELWSKETWESIKLALPDNKFGSRVVITTRHTDIAATASSLYCTQDDALVYNLPPLTLHDSWTLFCMRSFGSKDNCPPTLKDLTEQIVKKCGGLPLAIVTISGLLATKPKTVEQWRKLHDRLGSEMETEPTLAVMKKILSLSYEDLPYHLKLCFLYLSIFPEDYTIRRSRLERLWMGEGFVNATHEITVEDMADEYFDELVKRSIIQVTETDPSGRARSCKVHDIMREVIISKSREEDFFYSIVGPSSPRPRIDKVRRLTTQCDVNQPLNVSLAHLRSLILFSVFVSSSLKSAKLLRVLDVERQDIGHRFMPHGSQLQHLRYLNLRGTRRAQLPEALSMLQSLEMLDLRDSSIYELPAGIVKLRRLRYLAVYSSQRITATMGAPRRQGAPMPKGIGGLGELCTLVLANAEPGFIEELEGMQQLRRLGVARLTMENEPRFWDAIQKLSRLRSLTADSKEDNLMSSIGSLGQLPSLLRSLKLYGLVMEKLPGHLESLKHLAKMVLSGTKLAADPFPLLQSLPSLSELRLHKDAYVGKELHSRRGFSRLRTMHLMDLGELEVVTVKVEAMPIVESLRIKGCGKGWPTAGRVDLRMEGRRESLIDIDRA